jgi:hypothetical protein
MEITKAMIARAATARSLMVCRSRDNGDPFWTLMDGRPDWAIELVLDAHGEFGPDDHRYEMIKSGLDAFAAADPGTELGDLEPSHLGMVDDMTADLCAWLASSNIRLAYCDEAMEDGWSGTMFELMQAGQEREAREVLDLLGAWLESSVPS